MKIVHAGSEVNEIWESCYSLTKLKTNQPADAFINLLQILTHSAINIQSDSPQLESTEARMSGRFEYSFELPHSFYLLSKGPLFKNCVKAEFEILSLKAARDLNEVFHASDFSHVFLEFSVRSTFLSS